MSTMHRRAWGAVAALIVLLLAFAYVSWRLRVIGREGWAGISYFPVVKAKHTPQPALGLTPGSVYVLYPGSPAEKSGILRGDRLLAINGVPLDDPDGLPKLAKRLRRGDTVVYRVDRVGNAHQFELRLGSPTEVPVFLALFGVTCAVAL